MQYTVLQCSTLYYSRDMCPSLHCRCSCAGRRGILYTLHFSAVYFTVLYYLAFHYTVFYVSYFNVPIFTVIYVLCALHCNQVTQIFEIHLQIYIRERVNISQNISRREEIIIVRSSFSLKCGFLPDISPRRSKTWQKVSTVYNVQHTEYSLQ